MTKKALRQYFPNLDGVRGIAFLLVFFGHCFHGGLRTEETALLFEYFKQGTVGLDLFFVLSGFLITWVILKEWQQTERFRIGHFLLRRVLRIWPLYFLLLAISFGILYWYRTQGAEPANTPEFWRFASFTVNFHLAEIGPIFFFPLVILWSISVEEQFYLVWGSVLRWLRKFLLPVILILIIGSIIFRWLNVADKDLLYFHSLSVMGDFATGAFVAWLATAGRTNALLERLKNMKRANWLIVYVLLALTLAFHPWLFGYEAMMVMERQLYATLFAAIIFEQAFATRPLLALGRWKSLRYTGKVSYGLYGFHALAIVGWLIVFEGQSWLSDVNGWLTLPLLALASSYLAAAISWIILERPILKLKSRFRAF